MEKSTGVVTVKAGGTHRGHCVLNDSKCYVSDVLGKQDVIVS